MPTRKLVKHGPSTFIVSLPRAWIDRNDFKKGDEIRYEETPSRITFIADKDMYTEHVEVDVTGLDRSYIMILLRALYRKGVKNITVKFEDLMAYHLKDEKRTVSSVVDEEVRRLIGLEVTMHSRYEIRLKQLAEPSNDEIEASVHRLLELIEGMFADIVEALNGNNAEELITSEEKHDTITTLISYLIRGLYNEKHEEDAAYLIHTLMQLDVITDFLKYFSREARLAKITPSKTFIAFLRKMQRMNTLTLESIPTWDNSTAAVIGRLREEIKVDARGIAEPADRALLFYLLPALEVYRDIIHARMCISREPLFSKTG